MYFNIVLHNKLKVSSVRWWSPSTNIICVFSYNSKMLLFSYMALIVIFFPLFSSCLQVLSSVHMPYTMPYTPSCHRHPFLFLLENYKIPGWLTKKTGIQVLATTIHISLSLSLSKVSLSRKARACTIHTTFQLQWWWWWCFWFGSSFSIHPFISLPPHDTQKATTQELCNVIM